MFTLLSFISNMANGKYVFKRKRGPLGGSATGGVKRRRTSSSRVVAGYTRSSGYYGRFGPSGPELKFLDTSLSDSSVSINGDIASTVNAIAEGTGPSQRVGRKCTVHSVHWRYEVRLPAYQGASAPNNNSIRVILYLDKQTNGTAATASDILDTPGIRAFRNLANSGRFNILMDKIHNVSYEGLGGDGTTNDTSEVIKNFTFNKKVNIPIEFNADTGALSEMRSNNMGVLLVSANGVVTPSFNSVFRIRFSG